MRTNEAGAGETLSCGSASAASASFNIKDKSILKIISTGGEGGMVTTNNEDLYFFMRSYKDHGKNFAKVWKSGAPRAQKLRAF